MGEAAISSVAQANRKSLGSPEFRNDHDLLAAFLQIEYGRPKLLHIRNGEVHAVEVEQNRPDLIVLAPFFGSDSPCRGRSASCPVAGC